MEYKVIIPSAKVVPAELQRIGRLPAVIYPFDQKTVFDHLYKQYKDKCRFIKIICYDRADEVHRRLAKYEGEGLIIEDLPFLEDLGYTIHFALRDIDSPVIINFADTIVLDDIMQMEGDAYFYSWDYMSDIWTYFDEKNGRITSVYDKVSIVSKEKKRLFVGVFKIMDTLHFRKCLDEMLAVVNREEDSLYSALMRYSEQYPMEAIETNDWFDIGHMDTYHDSSLGVKAREFNHITIDKERGILRKSSDDVEKFIGEIRWYLKLPTETEYVRPRIFDYSIAYDDPYIAMEYYSYHTLHELFLYGDLTYHQWAKIFGRIRFVCNDLRRYTVSGHNIRDALEDMYLTKTLHRLDELRSDIRFKAFFHKTIHVNHVAYRSLEQIRQILSSQIPEMLYDIDKFYIIHGDLCFSNILVDNGFRFIKVVDPRGKFGTYDIYGDFRYELAKLLHSIDGKYDLIIKDLFTVDYDLEQACISYIFQDVDPDRKIYRVFTEVFQDELGNDLKKIELIEALLFLSMIPLHGEDLHHQLVMLGTGIEILNRVIDIRS